MAKSVGISLVQQFDFPKDRGRLSKWVAAGKWVDSRNVRCDLNNTRTTIDKIGGTVNRFHIKALFLSLSFRFFHFRSQQRPPFAGRSRDLVTSKRNLRLGLYNQTHKKLIFFFKKNIILEQWVRFRPVLMHNMLDLLRRQANQLKTLKGKIEFH